jgi:hypothetical protein
VIFGVATDTVARDDIVVQVVLEFAGDGDGVAVNRGSQVWPLESLGEDTRVVGRSWGGRLLVLSFCPVFHSRGACVQLAFVVLLASTFVCPVLFAVGLS